MKELQLWVQTDDTKEIVENYILSLIKEDASYYAGNVRVIVHNSENSEQQRLSHVYDVSGKTVNTFREHYGDSNIALIERTERELISITDDADGGMDLEELESRLEDIAFSLKDIGDSLKKLTDCISETPRGTLFSVCGDISTR